MTYMSEKDARNLICEFGRRLYEKDMVAANDGNTELHTTRDNAILFILFIVSPYPVLDGDDYTTPSDGKAMPTIPFSPRYIFHFR